MTSPVSCPDPGTLAGYLDGQLFAEERERVEEHLSGCPDCCRVLAETVRFQAGRLADAPPARGSDGTGLRLASSIAAVLAAALLLDVPAALPRRDPRAPLLAATEGGRPVLPRLTGGFAWAPLDEPLRSLDSRSARGAEPARWRYFAAAEEVRKGAEAAADSEGIGALGAANLMVGNVDEAVALLERAVAREPSDARRHSDLAAALIARGMAREGTDDLARALESASSALTLSSDLPEARFNRALALELLPLPSQARREWRRYAAADSSPWGREAEERLRRLADPAIEDGPTVRARLEAAAIGSSTTAGAPTLPELVRRYRHQARRAIQEDLLPAWGEFSMAGTAEPAAASLRAAEVLAREWSRQTSDAGLEAAVDEIRRASPARARELARGWRQFGEASVALEERRLEAGHAAAVEAVRALAGGPAQAWAETLELTAAHYLGSDGIPQRLERLHPGDLAGRARVQWIRGLVAIDTGHHRDGIPLYQAAIDGYEALGEAEPVALLHFLLTEIYSHVGDRGEAWRHLRMALAAAPTLADRQRAARIVSYAAEIAIAEGRPMLAAAFLDELTADTTLAAATGDASEAHLVRAQVALAFDERADANAHLGAAARAAGAIVDPVLRRRITAGLEFVRGLASTDPRAQLAAFSRAEAGFRATGMKHRRPAVLLERGLVLARAGQAAEAERTLHLALALMDEEKGEGLWLDEVEPVSRLFDAMVSIALQRGAISEAFRWAEAGRASALHGALSAAQPGAPRGLDARAVQAALDPRTALLFYALLPDRAVVFQLSRDGLRAHTLEVPTEELRRMSASFVGDFSAGSWTERTRSTAIGLYSALISPLDLDPSLSRIAIVADDELHDVPFAALVDPRSGSFLLEQRELVAAPSAAVYLSALGRARLPAPAPITALVVGDPRLDPVLFPSLAPLPNAAAEAKAVAALYPGAELFVGPRATRDDVVDAMARHHVVHFAGHATINSANPRLSGLPLASVHGRPAWLHAEEVPRLSLAGTRVVVLSACDTAQGPIRPGEGPLSLARAFLAARVPTVVATLWPVSDSGAGPLLAELHRRLRRGDDAVAALRGAQLSLLRSRQAELRSPSRWAAYQALGG